jgi:putative spermidine/putrescine transport system permease protein
VTLVLAADGRPLKASLNRALRRQKLRALMLIAPLLIFILVSFVMPIADMLFRSVENEIVVETLPRTVATLDGWDSDSGQAPDEDVFTALYFDMVLATEYKTHTRLGSRLNYEMTGISSLFRKSGRGVGRFDTDTYTDAFQAADPAYADPAQWAAWMADDTVRAALPMTANTYDAWAKMIIEAEEDVPVEEVPWDFVFTSLYLEVIEGAEPPVALDLSGVPLVNLRDQFADVDEDWLDPEVWQTIKIYSPEYTNGYFLNSVDRFKGVEGAEVRPENEQIYITLFIRTMIMSGSIMGMCVAGVPDCLAACELARAQSQLADDPCSFALLDIAAGAHIRVESPAATTGRDQRYTGLVSFDLVWPIARPRLHGAVEHLLRLRECHHMGVECA